MTTTAPPAAARLRLADVVVLASTGLADSRL